MDSINAGENSYNQSLKFAQQIQSETDKQFSDHYTDLYSSCRNYLNMNDIDGLNAYLGSLTNYDLFYLNKFLEQYKDLKFSEEISSIITKKLSNSSKQIILKKSEK